jgi:dTDP-4-amino-4,6-dideoxygalactose transaminase
MIPFHAPSIGEEEIAEVVDTLRSGWLSTGPKVQRFEQLFSAYVSARHAVAVNSGTAALQLALEAVGLRRGDEVIIPTYTFAATGEAAVSLGARPVLADCRADTLNIDATTIESLVTPRTKAIVPVHIAGQACEMDPILVLAARYGLHVVEDAAHALPTIYKGRAIGSVGDLTAFSFYATKSVTTGEGGMVTTEREDLAARIRRMRLHGLAADAWSRESDQGSPFHEVLDVGFKCNLTDIAAAIGIHQVRKADAMWRRRGEIASAYTKALADLDTCATPREASYGTHAWHLYILEVNPQALARDRDEVVRRLRARGVGTSVHFLPLHLHRAYRRILGDVGAFPVAEQIFARALSLPIYPRMTDADISHVIQAVRDTLGELRR